MTHFIRKFPLPAIAVCLFLLLPACATVYKPPAAPLPPSQMIETADLSVVADAALQLASDFGADEVLVVLDIDNTLLAMEQGLGSDQWYDWQEELQAAEPCSLDLVADRLAVQGALYFASAMRPTQADAAAQVLRVQTQGLKVVVVTSRGADFRLQTFRELRRANFSFYANAIGPAGGYNDNFIPEGGSRPARYEDGVFLTAGQDKGVMLQALLAKTGTPLPAFIVMADDKTANLQAVLDAFDDGKTSVQAYRYNAEDAAVSGFDRERAAQEWRSVEPSLRELETVFGADNYTLPASKAEDCVTTSK